MTLVVGASGTTGKQLVEKSLSMITLSYMSGHYRVARQALFHASYPALLCKQQGGFSGYV